MLLSVALLTGLDAILKALSARHDVLFLAWGRNLGQATYLLLLLPWIGPKRMFRTSRPWLHAARGLFLLLVTVAIVFSLNHLTMAQTYSVTFTTPLLATALAALFLGERVTPTRALLILGGFVGVVVSLGPDLARAGLAVLFPLGMAAANACFHVLTRYAGRQGEDAYALLFSMALAAALIATPTLPWTANAMSGADLALLAVGALLGTVAHLAMIGAFRLAPTVIVSPMMYAQVIVAAAIGYLAFGEVPGPTTYLGAAIVALSGYLLLRTAEPPAALPEAGMNAAQR
ncbi:MAG: DMT family transporter, partial [Methylobacteriaceae bacterium]|nr:DMT family transporter [Methylobacteriaceae bacterium]